MKGNSSVRRTRPGPAAAAIVAAVVVLLLAACAAQGTPGENAAPGDPGNAVADQEPTPSWVQVVITSQVTAAPVSQPTFIPTSLIPVEPFSTAPALPDLPDWQDAPVAATPVVTAPGRVTPNMDLGAMPLRQCNACINILLLGLDARPGDNPNTARTDSLIVLSINTETRAAGMLSIPRDLYVPMPGGKIVDRINTAMARGGPAYAMKTVEYNTGIPIQHYVRISFDVVTALVDLVGGVDVEVDQDINDPRYPDMNNGYDPFVLSKGLHHLDGATALKYARTRHQTSDFDRMRRQQQVILALRDRALSTDAIPQLLPKLPAILGALGKSISTDLSLPDMVRLILLARDVPPDKIAHVTFDLSAAKGWVTPSGAQVLLPQRERIDQLAAQLLNQPWAQKPGRPAGALPASLAAQEDTADSGR
jgi:polyisoprenyl-teichoic acid--peptidoglycan teichoic acid transferase